MYPIFLAHFSDGSYGLLDVRPAELVDEPARQQFEETAKVCGELGWHYRVLTGHDSLATRNLDCVSASRHDRCRPTARVEALILGAARGGRTRGELCRIVSPDCPPLACAWVDNLAWRRLLGIDLAATFNSDTVYTTSELIREGALRASNPALETPYAPLAANGRCACCELMPMIRPYPRAAIPGPALPGDHPQGDGHACRTLDHQHAPRAPGNAHQP